MLLFINLPAHRRGDHHILKGKTEPMDENTLSSLLTAVCCLGLPLVVTTVALVLVAIRNPKLVDGNIRAAGIAFGIGMALLLVVMVLIGQMVGAGSNGLRVGLGQVGIALAIVFWILSCIGWDNFPARGGGGFQLKMIATVLLGASVFGLPLLAYWTGKCLLRWLGRSS